MPRGPQDSRFIVDSMLGSLARKLRIFGFDTAYGRSYSDEELIAKSIAEGRILLTSDRELYRLAKRKGIASVLCTSDTDEDRLIELFSELNIPADRTDFIEPRCSLCNSLLIKSPKREAEASLPRELVSRYESFYRCPTCGKFYWHGSHWKKIMALRARLKTRLA